MTANKELCNGRHPFLACTPALAAIAVGILGAHFRVMDVSPGAVSPMALLLSLEASVMPMLPTMVACLLFVGFGVMAVCADAQEAAKVEKSDAKNAEVAH
eukprot:gnl/MRDRNA2_/MRDRNA2_89651_c0_seq1.p2 gnl/MRDRNA2_/MRDRNA2_89651_c0~~gnl/MRDRNA2_/MRDRNA2_89651_c0_seq1.p2  ORF type:complete len:100 (+),score=23.16 gnl/MRDRNA2_/MRDRNA2_89651_c0_seq1:100-399(+)